MATNLAPVYLDDARVQLQGDPRPKVAKIVAAGGKVVGDDVEVVRLRDPADERGTPLRLEDVIDRAGQPGPVYLRCRTAPAQGKPNLAADESSGPGATRSRPHRPAAAGVAFGAARPGMAGQGATGSPGDLPADKRAKSDFQPGDRPGRPQRGNPDSTQEFQSGGRSGEGLEASYTDEGVGSTGRRQAGRRPSSGARAPEQGAQGGAIRDAATDARGRQQGQPTDEASPAD